MGNKRALSTQINKEEGQSTVEYILLLLVVVALFNTVLNSRFYKDFFGEDSAFFTTIAQRISLDYRYAQNVSVGDDVSTAPVQNHPSFAQPDGSTSRFFGYSTQEYPP